MCCAPDYYFFLRFPSCQGTVAGPSFPAVAQTGSLIPESLSYGKGEKTRVSAIIRVGCIVDDPGAMRRVNRTRVRCECAPFKGGTRSIILEDCVHIFLNSNGNERICILGHPDGIPDFWEACVVETHLPMRAFHVRGTQHSLYFVIMKALLFIYRPGR